jgi:hypothetical protein
MIGVQATQVINPEQAIKKRMHVGELNTANIDAAEISVGSGSLRKISGWKSGLESSQSIKTLFMILLAERLDKDIE